MPACKATGHAHNFKDLTGQEFGRLAVIEFAGRDKHKQALWKCRCQCGTEATVKGRRLITGHTASCGCLLHEKAATFIDRTGHVYGNLTVLEFAGRIGSNAAWKCRCTCGNVVTVIAGKKGTTHCGCLKRANIGKANRRHGRSGSPEHRIWCGMNKRCRNKNDERYGGRGITVCDRWRNSFENFLADMGPRPSPEHSIERKDNDGPYSPDNCTWATKGTQSNNTSRSRRITRDGLTMTVCKWAKRLNTTQQNILARLNSGWTEQDALSKPFRKLHRVASRQRQSKSAS